MHKRTLTWENLWKKGFIGPSCYPLCENEEESMNHLLNICKWTESLWNWLETIFKRTDRDRNSLQESIVNWRSNFSKTQIVNTLWKLIPGFLVWMVWKEQNRRVFQNEAKTIEFIRATILQNMREMTLTRWKTEQNKDLSVTDLQILQTFGIEAGTISSSSEP